jgi:DNA-binding CsgD family transcriptional regulator
MLLGRDRELGELREALVELKPLVVVGEPGVGKTATIRAAAADANLRLLDAGSFASLSWLPYFPVERATGRTFRGGDDAYVAEEVERAVGDDVLFLDDLHWADSSTLALLPFLAGRVRLVAAVRLGDAGTKAALDQLAMVDARRLDVTSLEHDAAAALVAAVAPRLAGAVVDQIVERGGGNPFVLHELAAAKGEASLSLRRALAARARALSEEAREVLALVSLAGRPLERSELGPGSGELVESALVTLDGDRLRIQHALLADAVIDDLEDDLRRRLHARLAALVKDPGEAAQHHASAGEQQQAFASAMLAAERASRPGERAVHLGVAASCATGAGSDLLRLEAAAALADAGDYGRISQLLDAVRTDDPLLQAKSALLEARAAWAARDAIAARTKLAAGRSLVAGTGTAVEAQLVVDEAKLELESGGDPLFVLDRARAALAFAERLHADTTDARYVVGCAAVAADAPDWEAALRGARAAAAAHGDSGLECASAEKLAFGLFSDGRGADARAVAQEMIARSHTLRLHAWERRFRCRLGGFNVHAGAFRAAFESGSALAEEPLEPWERFLVHWYVAQSASDLGRHEDAARLVHGLDELVAGSAERARKTLWARAETALWAGRPRETLAAADEALDRFPNETSTFVHVARAWACIELERDPGIAEISPARRFLAGARPELEALQLLASCADAEAAACFRRAADLWRGQHARGELRCLWAEGEALRRAGDIEGAVACLERAERAALEHEHEPLVARARRSLRLAGVRRAADARAAGILTAREREVLELVGAGLTNVEIGRRLGIGRPTVARLVSTASSKLGAHSRGQAAALAERT